jgi:hypothetical protein
MGDELMSVQTITQNFRQKVCDQVRVEAEGVDRYRVFTPFLFEDGDHLVVVLKQMDGRWVLSDEGHTFMHLTYDLDEKDLRSGSRQKIISNALAAFSVEDRNGELILSINNEQFGDALYSYVQACSKFLISPICHGSVSDQHSWMMYTILFRNIFKKGMSMLTGMIRSMILTVNILRIS